MSRRKRKITETTLGTRLRKAREAVKFSAVELAGKIGMREQYIRDIENDLIADVPADVLMRIARALGTTIADLCGLPKRQAPAGSTPGQPIHHRRSKAR